MVGFTLPEAAILVAFANLSVPSEVNLRVILYPPCSESVSAAESFTSLPVKYSVPSANVNLSLAVSPILLMAVLASLTPGISILNRF